MSHTSRPCMRWSLGGRRAVRASALGVVALTLVALAPVGSPVASAHGGPTDEVGCGVGVSAQAQSVERAEPSTPPVEVLGGSSPGVRSVAGITLIPPTAATAGIASGARSFRTTVGTKPAHLAPFRGSLVFSGRQSSRGREPWIATPTTARRLRDIAPGATSSSPRDFVPFGDLLYFSASDGEHGRELWRTDGTGAGTRMVKDIRPGARGSDVGSLYVFQNRLYFVANDGVHGGELWRTDGTAAGTRLFKDIRPGADTSLYPAEGDDPTGWAVLDGRLYFAATRTYSELWRTDGTTAGTRRVAARLILSGPIVATPTRLFFQASHDDGGCALDGPFLFTSDGTTVGTRQLAPAKYPWGGLVAYRGRAWFGNQVERSNGQVSDRPRLWRSEGTDASTVQARPTVSMDAYEPLLAVGRRLFMSIGGGLAASDERGLNAKVLGDTASGWRSTIDVVAVGSRWYFPAGQGSVRELWRTEGTPATTRLALDVNPTGNGGVASLATEDGVIWFVGNDGIRGQQLWRYVPPTR